MRDDSTEKLRMTIIVVGSDSYTLEIARLSAELAARKLDLDDSLIAVGKAAGVAAEEMARMIREMESMRHKLELPDLQSIAGYNPLAYNRPASTPKKSRKSKRGHNQALDRVITKPGYC